MSSSSRGRIRPRPVSFGNPALGTYGGTVYTVENEESSLHYSLPENATPTQKVVAMTDVRPEQVPEGILNLARSHRPFIKHLKIMISSPVRSEKATTTSLEAASLSNQSPVMTSSPTTELMSPSQSLQNDNVTPRTEAALKVDSHDGSTSPPLSVKEGAASILAPDADEHDSSQHTDDDKPSRTYVILFQLSTQDAANVFVRDLHDVPYTSLDETERCSVYHVVACKADNGVSLIRPFFAPSPSDLGLVSSSSSSTESSPNDNTTTASPRHATALETHNCAVCLEKMNLEEESLLTTVCNHSFHLDCLLQWQDSPCPVCRYDHSGLDEALSTCHVCGTTESNYVCLICGVVSCGGAASTDQQTTLSSTATTDGSPPLSHARQHYDQTLHAYALDTETQHVWDFCGQGYVHRLLQNAKDGKLVEVNDPSNTTSHERSLSPGLSDAQETQVVHRKLEGFASQYYTLLKSQLEQQRIYYTSRLEEIRRSSQQKKKRASSDLILALKQERNQLMQRCMTLRQKHQKVSDNVAFLKEMNESLEANKAPMKQQIMECQRQRAEAREMIQKCLPPLEEKVTMLMLQLEESMNDNVEQAPNDNDKKPAAKKK